MNQNHTREKREYNQTASESIKGVFTHEARGHHQQPHQPSCRNPNANRQSNMQLGLLKSDPSDFYETSNQKYFSNKKLQHRNLNESKNLTNFKRKNHTNKRTLVFGEHKNDYSTESGNRFKQHVLDINNHGNQHTGYGRKYDSKDMLSHGVKNQYNSSYGMMSKENIEVDSLNDLMEQQTQQKMKFRNQANQSLHNEDLPPPEPLSYTSSYNSDYIERQCGKETGPMAMMSNRNREFHAKGRAYNDIISYPESNIAENRPRRQTDELRNRTPYGTTFNDHPSQGNLHNDNKRFSKNLQSKEFSLGNYVNDYSTQNKENYSKTNYMKNVDPQIAGQKNRHKNENIQDSLSNFEVGNHSNYQARINRI